MTLISFIIQNHILQFIGQTISSIESQTIVILKLLLLMIIVPDKVFKELLEILIRDKEKVSLYNFTKTIFKVS
jgi:hypothetical protein